MYMYTLAVKIKMHNWTMKHNGRQPFSESALVGCFARPAMLRKEFEERPLDIYIYVYKF